MHIFAISGLHVGIVGILLTIALKVLGVPRDRFAFWLLPLLVTYVVSTGMKASALRALSMAAVFILAPLFRRRPDVPTSIAVAAMILLFIDPMNILSPGFIFSFGVVISIVMVYSIVPEAWLQGGWIRNYTVSLVLTSLAASLVAIPLSALYFGTFCPISLVGNLLVVPLTFCIVLCGCLSLVSPWVNAVFNHAALIFIDLLLGSVSALDRIPYSSTRVDMPPVIALLLWFGGLIYLFTHATSALQRRYGITSMVCAVLLVLVC
jgi:competence protein ComEC